MKFITTLIVGFIAFNADKAPSLEAPAPKTTANVVAMDGVPPTARFTSIPYLTHNKFMRVKLSAYHASGIKYVEFTCNGKTRRESRLRPDQTGYYEYSYGVRTGRMKPGLYEVTATIVPNEGPSLTLTGNSRDFETIRNGYNGFWFSVGETATAEVGPTSTYATVREAVDALGESLTKGGTVRLEPGVYSFERLNLDNGDYTMTIDGQGKATIVNPIDGPAIGRTSSFHFTRCEFLMDDRNGLFFKGGRDARLAVSDSRFYSENPDGYRKSIQYLGKSYPGGLARGIYLEDVLIENVWKGVNGVNTAKRVTITRNTGDAFGSSPGAVIDCSILHSVKDTTFHGQHCDIVQCSTGMVTENRIYADIFAPRQEAQIGHFSNPSEMSNIAFVNWVVDARSNDRSVNINLNPDIDGLLMHNLWFYNGSIAWADSQHTNVSIRGCTFFKGTIGAYPFDDYSDLDIRFTARLRSDWGEGCTVGPILINEDDLTWEVSP